MSASTNYSNRSIDLGIFDGVQASGDVPIELKFGTITTGIQKLAEQVTVLLLSEYGSDPFDESFGADLMTSAKYGYIRTNADVESEFAISAAQVAEYLAAAETDDTPDDERLLSLSLESYTLEADQLTLTIKLTARSGDTTTFILPITAVIV